MRSQHEAVVRGSFESRIRTTQQRGSGRSFLCVGLRVWCRGGGFGAGGAGCVAGESDSCRLRTLRVRESCLVPSLPLRCFASGERCVLLLFDPSRESEVQGFAPHTSTDQRTRHQRTRSAKRAQEGLVCWTSGLNWTLWAVSHSSSFFVEFGVVGGWCLGAGAIVCKIRDWCITH